jgi:hypothetical protein
MREDDKKKKIVPGSKQDKKEKKVNPKHQEEQEKLFSDADQISPVSKKLDKIEKIELLNGSVTTWPELVEAHLKLKKFISNKLRSWEFTFPEEIYRQWRKLNGWDMNSKNRPMIFAFYTVRDVYGSLPREVYKTLDGINEFIYPGIRMYRYCQLVTEECHEDVRKIIKTIIGIAEKSKDVYEYRLKLAAVYGAPFSKSVFQMDAFRDNNDILGTT